MTMFGSVTVLTLVLLMSVTLGRSEDEGSRRITRSRYKMGYMFGKRSDLDSSAADLIIKSLAGKAISVHELSEALQSDAELALRMATHLDKNGDGYVAVSELL